MRALNAGRGRDHHRRRRGVGARVAGPQLAPDACWSTVSPPVVGVRLEFRSTLTSLMLSQASRCSHDHRRSAGIATSSTTWLRAGDEEGPDVVRTDIIKVAGDAERVRRLLPAIFVAFSHLRRHQRKSGQPLPAGQPSSPGKLRNIGLQRQ